MWLRNALHSLPNSFHRTFLSSSTDRQHSWIKIRPSSQRASPSIALLLLNAGAGQLLCIVDLVRLGEQKAFSSTVLFFPSFLRRRGRASNGRYSCTSTYIMQSTYIHHVESIKEQIEEKSADGEADATLMLLRRLLLQLFLVRICMHDVRTDRGIRTQHIATSIIIISKRRQQSSCSLMSFSFLFLNKR